MFSLILGYGLKFNASFQVAGIRRKIDFQIIDFKFSDGSS